MNVSVLTRENLRNTSCIVLNTQVSRADFCLRNPCENFPHSFTLAHNLACIVACGNQSTSSHVHGIQHERGRLPSASQPFARCWLSIITARSVGHCRNMLEVRYNQNAPFYWLMMMIWWIDDNTLLQSSFWAGAMFDWSSTIVSKS